MQSIGKINVTKMKNILRDGGFNSESFISWLKKEDMIECSATDDTKVRRIGKITVRCIWFKIDQNPYENGFIEECDATNPFQDP